MERIMEEYIYIYKPNLRKRSMTLYNFNEHENPKDTPAVKPILHMDRHERRYT